MDLNAEYQKLIDVGRAHWDIVIKGEPDDNEKKLPAAAARKQFDLAYHPSVDLF